VKLAVFDEEFVVKKTKPKDHTLAGEVGFNLIEHALDRDACIAPDLAPLGLARKCKTAPSYTSPADPWAVEW
jgi:hypothetical protein